MTRRPGITVLVPTSPIPSHPSTEILDACLAAIRRQLPDAEILIAADGYHDGACTEEEYGRYRYRLEDRADREGWRLVLAREWLHEANLTRLALPLVETDLVLFVEHDYALIGDIPWPELSEAVRSDAARMVRLSMEPAVPDVWRHLYLEDDSRLVAGVPMRRTVQWSTRPYLAGTDWLAAVHETYVGDGARHFVETVLHAVLYNAYLDQGEAAWQAWRLWTYAPAGDMTRFVHLDGRGDAPTRPVTVSYPGSTPEYAPAPVSEAIQ